MFIDRQCIHPEKAHFGTSWTNRTRPGQIVQGLDKSYSPYRAVSTFST